MRLTADDRRIIDRIIKAGYATTRAGAVRVALTHTNEAVIQIMNARRKKGTLKGG